MQASRDNNVVRTCVIGGATMTGLWNRNDLVLLGPPSDPAGIKSMKDGAKAFQRIAETKSLYLDAYGIGKRELAQKMWKKAKIKPTGSWILRDDSSQTRRMLRYASDHKAYVIFGRMPVVLNKISFGDLEIMVEGDPSMRRSYIVMEANPKVFPNTNREGAHALSDFLLSPEIQNFMKDYGKEKNKGFPLNSPHTAIINGIYNTRGVRITKGSRINNFTELALRFRLGLVDYKEQKAL